MPPGGCAGSLSPSSEAYIHRLVCALVYALASEGEPSHQGVPGTWGTSLAVRTMIAFHDPAVPTMLENLPATSQEKVEEHPQEDRGSRCQGDFDSSPSACQPGSLS